MSFRATRQGTRGSPVLTVHGGRRAAHRKYPERRRYLRWWGGDQTWDTAWSAAVPVRCALAARWRKTAVTRVTSASRVPAGPAVRRGGHSRTTA